MFNRKTTTIVVATAIAAAVAFLAAGPSEGASALPISSCGQTVTSNAVLTQDLNCPAPGITVGASGITIDLKGHTLKGTGSGYGIYNPSGHDGVRIQNGVVRNYTVGIRFWTADDTKVSNVVVSGNVSQGIYIDGARASIASSTASGNGNTGISVTGDAASIASSTAAGNTIYGISVVGDGASVKASTVSGNGWGGIDVSGNASKIKGNRVNANGFGPVDGFGKGIVVLSTTVAPTGTNVAHGNDDGGECYPASLC